jgi:hypothetical protein
VKPIERAAEMVLVKGVKYPGSIFPFMQENTCITIAIFHTFAPVSLYKQTLG